MSATQIIAIVIVIAGIAAAVYNSDWNPLKDKFDFGTKEEVQQKPAIQSPVPAPVTTPKPATTPAPTPAQGFTSNIQVAIRGFSFVSEETRVKAGTKVTWINHDAAGHTVTSDSNLFSSKLLSQGKTFEYVFNKPGTYKYHCIIHPDMKGTIVVE
jgi:plastocyanin